MLFCTHNYFHQNKMLLHIYHFLHYIDFSHHFPMGLSFPVPNTAPSTAPCNVLTAIFPTYFHDHSNVPFLYWSYISRPPPISPPTTAHMAIVTHIPFKSCSYCADSV